MTVDKAADSANPGNSADFTISMTNGGNGDDTVSLVTEGATLWSPALSESELTIASGATSTTLLSVTVPSDASANAASGNVMVHAFSEGCGDDTTMDCDYAYMVSTSVTANQVYGLTAGYYSNETDVVKDTASVQETMALADIYKQDKKLRGLQEFVINGRFADSNPCILATRDVCNTTSLRAEPT